MLRAIVADDLISRVVFSVTSLEDSHELVPEWVRLIEQHDHTSLRESVAFRPSLKTTIDGCPNIFHTAGTHHMTHRLTDLM